MAFDFKKEYKEFYMPRGTPSIVTVPKMNYIAVRGSGNPNDEDGKYKQAFEGKSLDMPPGTLPAQPPAHSIEKE